MKKIFKKTLTLLLTFVMLTTFGLLAAASGSSDSGSSTDQGSDSAQANTNQSAFADCEVIIKSSRIAKSYDSKDIIIVTFTYKNLDDEATPFYTAVDAKAFQNGVGLNECYIAADSANYSNDNQSKSIQKGASLDVEVAFELNDSTTDVAIEVTEWMSWNDAKITKTFKIA